MKRLFLAITKGEEIRFLGHLDYLRTMERVVVRSGIPIAFSEGFNPHMKISLDSALAVGASWAQPSCSRPQGTTMPVPKSSTDSADKAAIQAVLDNSKLGSTLNTGMKSLAVSSDAKFTLKANENGSVTVESSDAATKAAVQKFFDNNPALVKKFGQIQALSGLDDARKSLQVSPSDLRKRIEVESMAAWWSDSGSSSLYGSPIFSFFRSRREKSDFRRVRLGL